MKTILEYVINQKIKQKSNTLSIYFLPKEKDLEHDKEMIICFNNDDLNLLEKFANDNEIPIKCNKYNFNNGAYLAFTVGQDKNDKSKTCYYWSVVSSDKCFVLYKSHINDFKFIKNININDCTWQYFKEQNWFYHKAN